MNEGYVLEHVTVKAGKAGPRLLNAVSTTFEAGSITLLIGRNGAGKTTLLETMAGLRKLDAGSITVSGEPLWLGRGTSTGGRRLEARGDQEAASQDGGAAAAGGKRLRIRTRARLSKCALLRVGIALQHADSQWFAATVREELRYSLRPYKVSAAEEERRIEEAMRQMGLSMGLLEQDPWTLSGGQQRRLSLACLLACEPDWLLLDEPTAGLDAVGIRRLCAALQAHRAAGRSVVVATHDHSALWPLADAIAVMDGGGVVREAAAPAAAAAIAAAGAALRAQELLRAIGAAVPPQAPPAVGGALGLPPREAAAAIALAAARSQAAATPAASPTSTAAVCAPSATLAESAPAASVQRKAPVKIAAGPDESEASGHSRLSTRFDPRALLLSYIILASVILLKNSAVALMVSAISAVALLIPVRSLIRPWAKLIVSYAIFMLICVGIAGLSFNPISFDQELMAVTALRLGNLMVVMLLGMPLLAMTTPFRLQRGIEQSFGWLTRLKVPVYSFSLLVSLIFRFVPILTVEWERFSKLAHARGKAVSPLGTVPLRQLPVMIIPYIRSLLRMGEQMADALEARGFGVINIKNAALLKLRFQRSDYWLLIVTILVSLIIYMSGQ